MFTVIIIYMFTCLHGQFRLFLGVVELSLVRFCFVWVLSSVYSLLSLNGHLYKTDTSVKRTLRVGPCLSLPPLFDSL